MWVLLVSWLSRTPPATKSASLSEGRRQSRLRQLLGQAPRESLYIVNGKAIGFVQTGADTLQWSSPSSTFFYQMSSYESYGKQVKFLLAYSVLFR